MLSLKRTTDYLSPPRVKDEGIKIKLSDIKEVQPPETVFIKILSPTKEKDEAKDTKEYSAMKTPTRKINYDDVEENFKDTDKVLEMSPPIVRYNPNLIQHTFELNLDGITLEELEKLKKANEERIRNIEGRYFNTENDLKQSISELTCGQGKDHFILKLKKDVVHIPINSLAELNADMLNFDTNQSEPEENSLNISKRLMYELRFEKYLKKKIREEIERKSKYAREKYIPPEERLRMEKQSKIEEMVRERIEGKKLSPEEMERQRLEDQGTIDADEEYIMLLKQIFNETLDAQENEHPNMSDEDSYELKPAESVDKNTFAERALKSEVTKPFLKMIAREPKGVSNIPAETFEEVLKRMQKNYLKRYITWDKLLNYFTRKGSAISENELRKIIDNEPVEEVDENEIAAKNKAIKNEVNKRMSEYPMFPRNDGKGKYRITIPGDPAFMKRDKKKGKSIRERKLEEMIKYKYLEDEYEMSQQFRAKEVPKSTLEPRYENWWKNKKKDEITIKNSSY